MNLTKKFSIAHYDLFHGKHASSYYKMLKNADPRFLSNLHDIYFGKFFNYYFKGQKKRCGNPMGVEASDEQINYLFKIQKELGVEVSLTFNTLEIPHELLLDSSITRKFVEWIGGYYDHGLRSCTMSSEHIMRTGLLQKRCPEMRWKSTVNQIIEDAQQFIDHVHLGYNTILLNRSLNRNINELKRIRKAQEYVNGKNREKPVLTSLLVAEACIYHCPFKREHDSMGEVISMDYFDGPANLSCNCWRQHPQFSELPRSGINLIANSNETFAEFANLVDVLKYSGRFTSPIGMPDAEYLKAVWIYIDINQIRRGISTTEQPIYADDFAEIFEAGLSPLHNWVPGWIDLRYSKNDWRTTYRPYTGIWSSEKGRRLEKILLSCRNQCWNCHECERTFGMDDIDSALQFEKNYSDYSLSSSNFKPKSCRIKKLRKK